MNNRTISEGHVIAALESYLKAMGMMDDDEFIVSVKRNRNNDYDIEVDTE